MSLGRLATFHHAALRLATLLLALSATLGCSLQGQAVPTATGPGTYISLGVAFDGYHLPYGDQRVRGVTGFVHANLTQRYGLEGEATTLRFGTEAGTRASTYLIGPRVTIRRGTVQPYAKFLLGRGTFIFPFNRAQGSYTVLAPGAGLDLRLLHGRIYVRAVDFEYQDWRDFTFGVAHPFGVSTGISVRVF